jgi:hypothetical protein
MSNHARVLPEQEHHTSSSWTHEFFLNRCGKGSDARALHAFLLNRWDKRVSSSWRAVCFSAAGFQRNFFSLFISRTINFASQTPASDKQAARPYMKHSVDVQFVSKRRRWHKKWTFFYRRRLPAFEAFTLVTLLRERKMKYIKQASGRANN